MKVYANGEWFQREEEFKQRVQQYKADFEQKVEQYKQVTADDKEKTIAIERAKVIAEAQSHIKGLETQIVLAPYPPELPVCQPVLERA